MELDSGFKIILFSHPDYESLTAEVYFGDIYIAMIINEDGIFKIELSNSSDAGVRQYALDDFQAALSTAQSRLLE